MNANQMSFIIADWIEKITLVTGIIMLIVGIFCVIFSKKLASKEKEKAKPNSKISKMTEEEITKFIRICGVVALLMAICLIRQ